MRSHVGPSCQKVHPLPPGPTGRLEICVSLLDSHVHAAGPSRLPHSPVLPWNSSASSWLAKWLKHPCQHCRPVFANYTMYKHKHNYPLLGPGENACTPECSPQGTKGASAQQTQDAPDPVTDSLLKEMLY